MDKASLLAVVVAGACAAIAFSCVRPAGAGNGQAGAGAAGAGAAGTPVEAVMAAAIDPASLPAALSYEDLARLLAVPGLRLLDVRTAEEYAAGHIPGASLAPYDAIDAASFAEGDKAAPIVVYCRSGRRSALAKATLESLGYTNVSDFGGIDNWKGALEK